MRGHVESLHSRAYRRFLVQLLGLRRRAKLSQVELARRLKRDQTFVSKSERAERRLDVVELLAWCRACGENPRDFLDRLSPAPRPRRKINPEPETSENGA